ncbi:MAG: hypothetical protein NUV94_07355 [Candidatus Acetothermia bacterium]|jgi:hypothetical protein|nr:hypothetical protein [Candidatus Acetothermia bacterium]
MSRFRIPETLVNSYHAFVILVGLTFLTALVWPEPPAAGGVLEALMRGPFFLDAVAFLLGVLALHVGEAEHGFGRAAPPCRALRMGALVLLGIALILPFLIVHRVEAGGGWGQLVLVVLFLFAYGLFWSLVGHAAAGKVKFDGLRFFVKYGGLIVLTFLPVVFGLPLSPFPVLAGLWEGTLTGAVGLLLYVAVDLGALGWWLWTRRA